MQVQHIVDRFVIDLFGESDGQSSKFTLPSSSSSSPSTIFSIQRTIPSVSPTGFFIRFYKRLEKRSRVDYEHSREKENGGRKRWSERSRKSMTWRGKREEEATHDEGIPQFSPVLSEGARRETFTTERFETKQPLLSGGRHHHSHGNLCPAATTASQFSIVPPPSSTTTAASRSLITYQPDNLTTSTQICFNRNYEHVR
ncbi:hypothetical protein Agabi119p4_3996 [Agaricus bisporus var. burnettii]|uniref:Uncharacterized protein n=1 Tax=Agaricus bisporus var. burnettii TaxID=192524 RepID=A0A8H7KIH9_AGABI|nr:hypothetical protein Agabi119p4_3996 [Agaricus bisporus var. burnettii]